MNIAIIGSADGPTAIYVSSNIYWPGLIGLILAAAAIVIFFIFRKNIK